MSALRTSSVVLSIKIIDLRLSGGTSAVGIILIGILIHNVCVEGV